MSDFEQSERTLAVAEQVAQAIVSEGGRAAVIGAVALAYYGYPRATRDIDIATELDPASQLRAVAERCRALGWSVDVTDCDAEDPLGGVLTVTGPAFDPIQVVNFHNPWTNAKTPASAALAAATRTIEGSCLTVVELGHLVALKLYAGGMKGKADVLGVLSANADADLEAVREICRSAGLDDALEDVLRELP